MNPRYVTILTPLVFGMLLFPWVAYGQVAPQMMKLQGYLTDNSGGPPVPANGIYSMYFGLYDDELAGALIDSVGPLGVEVINGLYEVELPLPASSFESPDRFLEIMVDGELLLPRVRVASLPYAYSADRLGGDAVHVDAGGNVGIGTETPTSKLQVMGDLHATGTVKSGNSALFDGVNHRVTTDNGIFSFGFEDYVAGFDPITYSNTLFGVGAIDPTERLDVNGRVRVRTLDQNDLIDQVVVASPTGVLSWRDAATLGGAGGDDDWTRSGNFLHPFNDPNDFVGIGTTTPDGRLHVDRPLSANGTAARVTFDIGIDYVVGSGLDVSAPIYSGRAASKAVTASTGLDVSGGSFQSGDTAAELAASVGWSSNGSFQGVFGRANVASLYNSSGTNVSTGVGGQFLVDLGAGSSLDLATPGTGTYRLGGAIGRLIGDAPASEQPAAGFIAAIAGLDESTGSAETYAGYFDGTVRVTDLPADDLLDNVVVADGDGVLHLRDAGTISGEDGDWNVSGNDLLTIPPGNVGIGTAAPTAKLHVAGEGRIEQLPVDNALDSVVVADATGTLRTRDAATLGGGSDADWNVSGDDLHTIPPGNVGVGTSAPTRKLDVDGKARIRDLTLNETLDNFVVADTDGTLHTQPGIVQAICNLYSFTGASPRPDFCPRTVFVTSLSYTGDLGGIAGADTACNERAAAAGLNGTYQAWLSDSTSSPSTRFVHSTVRYLRVDGTTVADDWSDLTDGTLDASILLDEFGNTLNNPVWTGTEADGTAHVQAQENYCQDWTSAVWPPAAGGYGWSHYVSSGWSYSAVQNCDLERHLYCFEK